MKRSVIVFGLGHHCRTVHWQFFCDAGARFNVNVAVPLLVELRSARPTILQYLKRSPVKPQQIFWLNETLDEQGTAERAQSFSTRPGVLEQLNGATIESTLQEALDHTMNSLREQPLFALIASDQRSHFDFAALLTRQFRNAPLSLMIDKPVTAPNHLVSSHTAVDLMQSQFDELSRFCAHNKASRINVLVQRHYHEQYTYMKNQLKQVVDEFQIPVSSIQIAESDGVFTMPHEWFLQSHPYLAGNGKMLHSGYHMLDLFVQLEQLNSALASEQEKIDVTSVQSVHPVDITRNLPFSTLHKIMKRKNDTIPAPKCPEAFFGEADVDVLLKTSRCLGIVSSKHNGFSKRHCLETPSDLYKGRGRTKKEHVVVSVGPFMQINCFRDDLSEEDVYNITILRNSKLIGGKSVEKRRFELSSTAFGQPDAHGAKRDALLDWLRSGETRCLLPSQAPVVGLLCDIYRRIIDARHGQE